MKQVTNLVINQYEVFLVWGFFIFGAGEGLGRKKQPFQRVIFVSLVPHLDLRN